MLIKGSVCWNWNIEAAYWQIAFQSNELLINISALATIRLPLCRARDQKSRDTVVTVTGPGRQTDDGENVG